MATKKQKSRKAKIKIEDELEVESRPETAAGKLAAPEPDEPPKAKASTAASRESDDDLDDEGGTFEAQQGEEPDPRLVDDLTDRIFGSVLSRYGWQRHGNRLEHVGEVRERH